MSYPTYLSNIGNQLAEEIDEELSAARKKFPNEGRDLLIIALMEEVGELAQAFFQQKEEKYIHMEAVQVAALAVRIIKDG